MSTLPAPAAAAEGGSGFKSITTLLPEWYRRCSGTFTRPRTTAHPAPRPWGGRRFVRLAAASRVGRYSCASPVSSSCPSHGLGGDLVVGAVEVRAHEPGDQSSELLAAYQPE